MNPSQKYLDQVSRLLNPTLREIEPSEGDTSYAELAVRKIDAASRSVEAIVSTGDVDRYQEIVEPKAFKKWLKHFEANPVMLAAHDHSAWSTGEPTVIGKWIDLQITEQGLIATGQFMPDDELAEKYWKRYRDKFMSAFSVGFIAHSWEMREFKLDNGVSKRLRVFTEVELLEISAVAVPANRGALARAASFLAGPASGGDTDHTASQSAAIAKALDASVASSLTKALDPDSPFVLALAEAIVERQAHGPTQRGYFDDELPDQRRSIDSDRLLSSLRTLGGI